MIAGRLTTRQVRVVRIPAVPFQQKQGNFKESSVQVKTILIAHAFGGSDEGAMFATDDDGTVVGSAGLTSRRRLDRESAAECDGGREILHSEFAAR